MELTSLRNAIVGLPGVTGLSVEQRKRLTIGVELVSNPGMQAFDLSPVQHFAEQACACFVLAFWIAFDFQCRSKHLWLFLESLPSSEGPQAQSTRLQRRSARFLAAMLKLFQFHPLVSVDFAS